MNLKSNITIFTDGASRGNPGPGGFAAVIVYHDSEFQAESSKFKVTEIGGREERTTNNRMELSAAIEALSFLSSLRIKDKGLRITIYTDSSYLVHGITRWVHGWQKNGWKTKAKKDVENRDLWEALAELTQNKNAEQTRNKIEWKQIEGHAGVAGNVRCDEIATSYADWTQTKRGLHAEPINLYQCPLSEYPIKNILDVPRGWTSNRLHRGFAKSPRSPEHFASQNVLRERGRTSSQKKRSRARAYSYVSMVDGVVQTHETWGECERRVKGKRGARYKKVFSLEEERALIAEWQRK